MLFSFFHNFVKIKLVILFSRLISFFPIFNRVNFRRGWGLRGGMGVRERGTSWVGGGGYVGGMVVREGVRRVLGVRWWGGGRTLGGGSTLGGGAYVGGREYVGGGGGYVEAGGGGCTLGRGVDVRSWSKMLFLGTFWKITS